MRQNEGMATDFSDWITSRTNLSAREIGRRIDRDQSALTRGPVSANTVIAACLATEAPLLEGLQVAGFITSKEADKAAADGALESASDSALLTQLLHRAATREQDDHNDTGPSNSPSTPLAPVTGLHTDPLPYAALTEGDGNTMDNVPLEGEE